MKRAITLAGAPVAGGTAAARGSAIRGTGIDGNGDGGRTLPPADRDPEASGDTRPDSSSRLGNLIPRLRDAAVP